MKLMHAINSVLGTGILGGNVSAAQQHASQNSVYAQAEGKSVVRSSQTVFNGRISVEKVANGYIVNIAAREGYTYTTYIAPTIQEVNERIAASMVSFQLEDA